MIALDDPLAWVAAHAATDPVRRRVLEALARRAAGQPPGALRERLVARLVARAGAVPVPLPSRTAANPPSPLTALIAELPVHASPELRTVQAHQRTWRTLRMAHRMAEVGAPVPEHLGPLNNQVLATRALQQLQALSPGYLQRLLTQLDTLAALPPPPAAEAPAPRKRRPAQR